MLRLGPSDGTPVRRVLAIGAHSDDLEIGCGGTVLALTRANRGLAVDWVVLAAEGDARVSIWLVTGSLLAAIVVWLESGPDNAKEIGRASCRERVFRTV